MKEPTPKIDKKPFLTAILIIIVVGCAVFLILYGEGRKELPMPGPTVEAKREVTLYFGALDGKGLSGEVRFIREGVGVPEKEIEAALRMLIEGPKGSLTAVIPEGTWLVSVGVEAGLATVDLSREFVDNHWHGSTAELQSVYGIVNTLVDNFDSVDKVQILVAGERVETIAGHILIDRPLGPNMDIVYTQ